MQSSRDPSSKTTLNLHLHFTKSQSKEKSYTSERTTYNQVSLHYRQKQAPKMVKPYSVASEVPIMAVLSICTLSLRLMGLLSGQNVHMRQDWESYEISELFLSLKQVWLFFSCLKNLVIIKQELTLYFIFGNVPQTKIKHEKMKGNNFKINQAKVMVLAN